MDLSDVVPGLDVIYYSRQHLRSRGQPNGPARKLPARVISVGKKRVTIQLDEDGTFRVVEPDNLQVYKRIAT